ncbi:hypothetical protein V8G54_037640 [Vigna mungo]|uniref:Pentatricopeptide repeat-containing protein n=1 Tax=Vigna mungo TaxID=3915 RepID=A0AAQ3RFK1_VIGMU
MVRFFDSNFQFNGQGPSSDSNSSCSAKNRTAGASVPLTEEPPGQQSSPFSKLTSPSSSSSNTVLCILVVLSCGTPLSVPILLLVCSDFVEVHKGREVHGVVFKLGFDGDVFVGNTLLAFYGNCGLLDDATKVFDEMSERDKVSWNNVIGLCSLYGFYKKALRFFKEMVMVVPQIQPDLVTVVSVLPVCAETEDEVMATNVHCYALKVGLLSNLKVGNAFVDVYGKCGNEKASRKAFDEIDERNVISWNAIITSFSFRRKYTDAFDVFRLMIGEGVTPNTVTISSMLPVLGGLGLFKLGMEVHGFCLRMNIESDVFIVNALIDLCNISLRKSSFRKTRQRDPWSADPKDDAVILVQPDDVKMVQSNRDSRKICDFSVGKWVYDDTYPLYDSN